MSYPTDLADDEEQVARQRLAELSARFVDDGVLVTPRWREVFGRTWRHHYVPSYYPVIDRPSVICIGDAEQRRAWLEVVYSDQTLVTKVVQTATSRFFGPATFPMFASSSTMPSLVLRMLESLDVRDGHRVLEIGTGTGYNCALLCERLGSAQVTSVDIDPQLIDLAEERLRVNGYTPTLAAVDGAEGYPAGAPYDRIIATCAVETIPAPWLKQCAPGALILADVRGKLGGNPVLLTVTDEAAVGRFVSYGASFMWMRDTAAPVLPTRVRYDQPETTSTTDVDPAPLLREGHPFCFVAQWHLPDASRSIGTENGHPALHLSTPDGSTADVIAVSQADGRFPVVQSGPRRLWDRIEEADRFWTGAGRPGHDRFGLTATEAEQYVWFDDPDNGQRWPL